MGTEIVPSVPSCRRSLAEAYQTIALLAEDLGNKAACLVTPERPQGRSGAS